MRGSEPRKKRRPSTSGHWTRPTVATRSTLCTTASSPARIRTAPSTVSTVPTTGTVMPVLSTSKHHPQPHHHQQQRAWARAQARARARAHGDWDHYTLRAATSVVAINPTWGPAAEFHELFAVGTYGVLPSPCTVTAFHFSRQLKNNKFGSIPSPFRTEIGCRYEQWIDTLFGYIFAMWRRSRADGG